MTLHTTIPDYDAIVAGAGPTGLFLACELALAGCRVLVLERAADPHAPIKALPFGLRGLSAPTIDALDRRGLLDELDVPRRLSDPFAGLPPAARRQAGHFAGLPFHLDDIDTAQWPYRLPGARPASLLAEMAELEAVLARRAAALGAEIRRGHAVDTCTQDDGGVAVTAGGRRYTARWVVGCDGARSAVRKAAGIAFDGTEPTFTGYSARIDVAGPPLQAGRVVTPRGLYFQSRPGYFAIQEFDGGAFHDAGQPASRAHVEAVLRRVSGTDVTVDALHLAATWTDRARQAAHYRAGRILLAGDAAHIHSPLGGQGLNLGIGDAMNLGWKLAAAIRGDAPAQLLDTYHAERHPVGAQVLDWSRAQVAAMAPDPGSRALRAVLRDLLDTRDGATYVAGRVWGVHLRYDLGDPHPLVGRGVPAVHCDDGTTVAAALRGGAGLVLDAGGDPSLRAWTERAGARLRYAACAAVAELDVTAALVRPDGIVAWAGTHGAGIGEAARRWGLAA